MEQPSHNGSTINELESLVVSVSQGELVELAEEAKCEVVLRPALLPFRPRPKSPCTVLVTEDVRQLGFRAQLEQPVMFKFHGRDLAVCACGVSPDGSITFELVEA
jgi:hypothetical protein